LILNPKAAQELANINNEILGGKVDARAIESAV
jgi:hypothetical protein